MAETVRIAVTVHGYLARRVALPAGNAIEVPEGAGAGGLLAILGLRPGDVGPILCDGALLADRSAPLADGSDVQIFPVAAGGV